MKAWNTLQRQGVQAMGASCCALCMHVGCLGANAGEPHQQRRKLHEHGASPGSLVLELVPLLAELALLLWLLGCSALLHGTT